jgi:hypothetical protein
MAEKYLKRGNGTLDEVEGTVESTGVSEAGKIVALNDQGVLDNSVLPTGIGADIQLIAASEDLAAGDFVNIYDNGGSTEVRKADASDPAKRCDGFVLEGVTAPGNATVYFEGKNNQCSALTGGTIQYLSATPGKCTSTAPSTSGYIVQILGKAISATSVSFEMNTPIKLA